MRIKIFVQKRIFGFVQRQNLSNHRQKPLQKGFFVCNFATIIRIKFFVQKRIFGFVGDNPKQNLPVSG